MTFISPTAQTDDNRQDAHLPVTETEREMGTWHRRDNPKNLFKKKNKKKQQLSKSIFTAAGATGTQNKHQTVKKTLL